jgi:hypothetical protein
MLKKENAFSFLFMEKFSGTFDLEFGGVLSKGIVDGAFLLDQIVPVIAAIEGPANHSIVVGVNEYCRQGVRERGRERVRERMKRRRNDKSRKETNKKVIVLGRRTAESEW